AVHEGYRQRAHMERDPDLDPLRQRKDYQELAVRLEKRYPQATPTPARQLYALQQEYVSAFNAYDRARRSARTVAEKKKAEANRPDQAELLNRFVQLAEKHHDAPAAVEALVLVLEASAPSSGGKVTASVTRVR